MSNVKTLCSFIMAIRHKILGSPEFHREIYAVVFLKEILNLGFFKTS